MTQHTSDKYINRELSWLEFNQRVLNEAADSSIPTLERLKFLAISSSNLDEFFMVRVGGLHLSMKGRHSIKDISGLRPLEQMELIRRRVEKMVAQQYGVFNECLIRDLQAIGIKISRPDQLDETQTERIETFFESEIYSSLSPIATEDSNFPLVPSQALNIFFRLQSDHSSHRPLLADEMLFGERFVVLSIGKKLPRFVFVPSSSQLDLVFVEDIVQHYSQRFFHHQEIQESFVFRVTRNADMRIDDEVASDLLVSMEDFLDERTTGDCVRLEVEAGVSEAAMGYLKSNLQLKEEDVYTSEGPLALSDLMQITSANGFEEAKDEVWPPQPVHTIDPSVSVFESIKKQDHVLFHPYQSYDPVVRLITEAASDENVLAIKQTLYRTSRDSQVVKSLQHAAETGKNVTVVLELKARFDEARNIAWARQLEKAGANVIYGVKGLKTHAKALLIVRREPSGIMRYCHFATGNYNEQTAKLYTDVSLLTCDQDLGADAAEFFNAITGFSVPQKFRKLEMAPTGMRNKFMEMIAIETQNARSGKRSFIRAKVNSLADAQIIRKLYEASNAGVEIKLNVRGICSLKPSLKGLSENIEVVSLVDRFLEHARIFHFHHGGDDRVFIASADWLPRNLDKRIELIVPVEGQAGKEKLISILETYFLPNDKAYQLNGEGSYHRSENCSAHPNTQKTFYMRERTESKAVGNRTPTVFTPHRSGN